MTDLDKYRRRRSNCSSEVTPRELLEEALESDGFTDGSLVIVSLSSGGEINSLVSNLTNYELIALVGLFKRIVEEEVLDV